MSDKDIKYKIGMSIRKCRLDKKISQEELAGLTGLHRTYISEVELGKRNVSLVNIEKISAALDIKLSSLFILVEME